MDDKRPTVLSNKRIIRGAEVDKPIPIASFLQENRGGVERVGDHGRSSVGHEIGLCDHLHIAELGVGRVILNVILQIQPLLRRRLEVKVDDVAVPRVVEGFERPLQHIAVAIGAGDEVGEARRRRKVRDRDRMELGFDEDGVRRRQGAVEGKQRRPVRRG